MKRSISAAVLVTFTHVAYAGPVAEARLNLQKWGFAYCLGKADAESRTAAARAQQAYFQRGAHEDERAYDNVRMFITNALEKMPMASATGTETLGLVGCLDIYQTKAYRKLIKAQDIFMAGYRP